MKELILSRNLCCAALIFWGLSALSLIGQEKELSSGYIQKNDVSYRVNAQGYAGERCKLDIYYPTESEDFPTVVWFHGGGLKQGQKRIPKQLQQKGIAVVAPNYRLSPKVKSPVYLDDAAAAVAWTCKNIERFGGSAKKIFVSGHSAGGYLTSMVGLDKSLLRKYDVDANRLAGLIPFSGHTITHFTVRAERGIDGKQPIVDSLAPLYHVRKDSAPILLITGDRNLEMLGRYEENAYLWRMLLVAGHQDAKILELDGYDHGGMANPAHPLLLKFVRRINSELATSKPATKPVD